jgi:hypothetical protein
MSSRDLAAAGIKGYYSRRVGLLEQQLLAKQQEWRQLSEENSSLRRCAHVAPAASHHMQLALPSDGQHTCITPAYKQIVLFTMHAMHQHHNTGFVCSSTSNMSHAGSCKGLCLFLLLLLCILPCSSLQQYTHVQHPASQAHFSVLHTTTCCRFCCCGTPPCRREQWLFKSISTLGENLHFSALAAVAVELQPDVDLRCAEEIAEVLAQDLQVGGLHINHLQSVLQHPSWHASAPCMLSVS